MKTYLINNGYSQGPFKAKGMGEIPMLPTTPAILNAIYDASGVRIINLPAKPEKILKALAEKQDVEGTEVCK
jgi:CO/xanthine dehydrogenase Mo-binding subunit